MAFVLLLAAAGACGWMCVYAYRLAVPAAPNLFGDLEKWETERRRATARAEQPVQTPTGVLGRVAVRVAEQFRVSRPDAALTVERDLAITGSTLEGWIGKTLLVAVAGFVVPVVLGTMFRAAGAVNVPFPLMLLGAVGLSAAMVIISFTDLSKQAAKARENFRDALSGFLDMLVMSLEGGRGQAEALPAVAQIGTGWEYEQLRHAIDNARTAGITPWESLGLLGERYGIVELTDLRTTLTLAQEEGGRIRDTLIARAQTMREARLADGAERADRRTDAMSLNLLFMAFLGAAYVLIPRLMALATSQ